MLPNINEQHLARYTPTSCEGYVTKRGHFRKSWRVRYLVISGVNMQVSYYESKDSSKSKNATPKGSFILQSAEKHEYWISQMVTGSVKEKPFGFKMVGHAPKQGYIELDVFVDSSSDMDQWLDVINNGLKASKCMAREAFMAGNKIFSLLRQ